MTTLQLQETIFAKSLKYLNFTHYYQHTDYEVQRDVKARELAEEIMEAVGELRKEPSQVTS